jgi:hypothetical protein
MDLDAGRKGMDWVKNTTGICKYITIIEDNIKMGLETGC